MHVHETPECTGTDTVTELTNIVFAGPNANIREHEEVEEREGHVACSLSADGGGGGELRRYRYEGEEQTYFDYANVLCSIFPAEGREQEQVARLERALRELPPPS